MYKFKIAVIIALSWLVFFLAKEDAYRLALLFEQEWQNRAVAVAKQNIKTASLHKNSNAKVKTADYMHDITWSRTYPKSGNRNVRYECISRIPQFKEKWLTWEGGKRISKDKLQELATIVVARLPHIAGNSNVISLIVETAITESNGGYFVKSKYGDHGIFQIKTSTAQDTIDWLAYVHKDVLDIIYKFYNDKMTLAENLDKNIPFGIAMCISEYWRKAGADFTKYISSQKERAVMWKSVYNTKRGLGTVAAYLDRNSYYVASLDSNNDG